MAFDGARAYGPYAGALRDVILHLKFHGRRRLGMRLGELLSVFWPWVEESCAGDEPLLLPVPLHAKRERERGFNQAELLARGLRDKVAKGRAGKGTAVERRCVRRVRATLPQTGLSLRQRQENVRGVFSVAEPERVRHRAVLLVDDVLTTGATVSACSAALRRAGASKILVLTLARASPQFPDQAPFGSGVPVDDTAPGWR